MNVQHPKPRLRGRAAHRKLAYVKRQANNTGVTGITEQVYCHNQGRPHRFFIVTPHGKRFNIDSLGRPEAWRRALRLRAEHESAILHRQLTLPRTRLLPRKSRAQCPTAKEARRG